MSMTPTGGPWLSRPCASPLLARLGALTRTRETAGRRFLERFATTRQAWIGHEVLVGVERFLAPGRLYPIRAAVGQEFPALFIVFQVGNHDLVEHLLMHRRVGDRTQRLDPAVEVPRHQVGR